MTHSPAAGLCVTGAGLEEEIACSVHLITACQFIPTVDTHTHTQSSN